MADYVHQPGIAERYTNKFGEMPSTALWQDDFEKLDALMEAAIKSGRKLTDDDLYRAQKVEPPPPDGIV